MTAEIVNLRRARKIKARVEKTRKADENRAKFGQLKRDKTLRAAEDELQRRRLDGLKREPPGDEPER
jgi:acyl-CoA reductase-like NAD-dependent aldehyde dehydrogenase